MSVSVIGAGAFGTALAVSIANSDRPVSLWARDTQAAADMQVRRENRRRLPGLPLPKGVVPTDDLSAAFEADTLLLALPMQKLAGFLRESAALMDGKTLIACCKGVDLVSLTGPTGIIADAVPGAVPAILTGPSFAVDIARGLPTALTLACADPSAGQRLQAELSTPNLRLYRSDDPIGAELGGALKNVVAIASGVAIGAALGESARAAIMTRGYAETTRLAMALGARAETLSGLSGFGDLALTCTSEKSRNYRYGLALGRTEPFGSDVTVEGVATAKAVSKLAQNHGIEMPIAKTVTALVDQKLTVKDAVSDLLSRPLRKE